MDGRKKINGAYDNRSHGGNISNRDDTIRDGRLLDTLYRSGDGYKYYYSFGLDRHHDSNCYHPYRRSDRGYFPNDFKKEKPPSFDGDVKKLKDAAAWIPGMNKFFELHNYIDNMKVRVAIFSLRGNADIWWEDVKWVTNIKTDDFS